MGFFRNIISSITSIPAYRDFAEESPGRALLHFFLIFTLLFTPAAVTLPPVISSFTDELGREIRTNVPDFRIVNGELDFKAEMPYIIERENNFILIVDTTGELNEAALDKYPNGVFVEKNRAVIKDEQQGINTIDFRAFKDRDISRESVLNFFEALRKFTPLIILAIFIFGFLAKIISILILSLIGLAMKGKANLTFRHTWGITCHALTLPMLLETVKDLAVPQLPGFFIIYFGIAIFYMYKGIQTAKEIRDDAGPVIPV